MHRAALLPAVLLLALPAGAVAGERGAGRWFAGLYSFSDELGGFRITGVTGTGSKEDPVVITQEFEAASPVTLVIRGSKMASGTRLADYDDGSLHIRVVALNNSGHAWVEFEFELQEILGKASLYGDGLSFDQGRSTSPFISSDTYAEYSTDFEPYDRLRFRAGTLDPLGTAGFSFLITDFTPVTEFYLVQDPRIPSS